MIFILGSGRSGTTWLAKMFDSHPDIAYLHEPDSVLRNHEIPFLPDPQCLDDFTVAAAHYLTALREVRSPKTVAHQPQFPKRYRTGARACMHQFSARLSKVITNVPACGERLLTLPDLFDRDKQPRKWVLKSVNSLCRMALFERARPNAQFIHIIRHPAGVVSSLLRSRAAGIDMANAYLPSIFSLPEAAYYPFTYDDMVSRPLSDQLAYSWMLHNDKACLDMQSSNRYRAVHYETLCVDLVNGLQALFAFAEIDWDQSVDALIQKMQNQHKKSPAYFDIMRSPTASMDLWQRRLTMKQISGIEEITSFARAATVHAAARF